MAWCSAGGRTHRKPPCPCCCGAAAVAVRVPGNAEEAGGRESVSSKLLCAAWHCNPMVQMRAARAIQRPRPLGPVCPQVCAPSHTVVKLHLKGRREACAVCDPRTHAPESHHLVRVGQGRQPLLQVLQVPPAAQLDVSRHYQHVSCGQAMWHDTARGQASNDHHVPALRVYVANVRRCVRVGVGVKPGGGGRGTRAARACMVGV